MTNNRNSHVGKTMSERQAYGKSLTKQTAIDPTYSEDDFSSTDSTGMDNEPVTAPKRRNYKRKPKPTIFTSLKENWFLTLLTTLSTIFSGIFLLVAINLNREVGVVDERLKNTNDNVKTLQTDVNSIKNDNATIHKELSMFQTIQLEIQYIKEKFNEKFLIKSK